MRWARLATRTVTSSSTASSGRRNNLRLYAGGRKKQIDVHGPFTVSSEAHSRDSPCVFLLEQHSHNITAALKVKHELLRGIVAIRRNGDVHITSRTRLRARGDCEAADQSTRHAGVTKFRENALQRALDRVQRRGHAAGIPTPSPNSAPGRRAYQAPTRSSKPCSEIAGDSRRSRWRSMRSATSISANVMRSFSLGVSRPGSDMVQEYHDLGAGRAQERDTNWTRRPRNGAFLEKIAQRATASGAVGQWFESTGARKEPTREVRPECDEEHFRCR